MSTQSRMLSVEERLSTLTPNTERAEAIKTIGLFLTELEKGTVRAAVRDADGIWSAQAWVKQGKPASGRIEEIPVEARVR